MELVAMGTSSRQAFELAVDYVSHAKAAISAMVVDAPTPEVFPAQNSEVHGEEVLEFDAGVAAPPRVRSRGRPKELRFKSPIESPGSSKPAANAKKGANDAADCSKRRSTRFLKTGVYVVDHCGSCGSTLHRTSECVPSDDGEAEAPTRRRCKKCGEAGHNRSTCGRKSSYVAK
jgi:hypothetical protein